MANSQRRRLFLLARGPATRACPPPDCPALTALATTHVRTADLGDGPPLKPLPSHDGQRSPQRSHGGVGLSRKNRPQRCSICKECGHKSRTCRFAQGKGAHRPPPRHRVAHHDLSPAAMTVSQRACLTTARMCARARVCVRSRPAPRVARHLRLDRLADVFLLSRSRFTVLGLYTGCALRGMGRGEHAYLDKGERR